MAIFAFVDACKLTRERERLPAPPEAFVAGKKASEALAAYSAGKAIPPCLSIYSSGCTVAATIIASSTATLPLGGRLVTAIPRRSR